MSFDSLGLQAELLRAVAEQGYTEPTPIQKQAIPVVLAGRDLLGAAQTGTGKTAGFVLPMLQRLTGKANVSHSPARHPVRALIITPTRELAAQVEESVRTYGKFVGGLKSALVYGGVGMQPQIDALRRGVDVLVATPGRLLDHVQQKTVDLRQVEILVLDEADRMLDMGFIHDIRKILALLPTARQNLLFSATFPEEIRKLASTFMKDPVTVEVARRNTPAELVAQVQHPVDAGRKRELLAHLVTSNDWHQVLVFVKTKHGANRLAQQLARSGVEADAIHGNKSQNARTRALQQFKEGSMRVLVATDIAARGLDIEALPHVVNYDLPHVAEDYVHRIGRTGRAGSEGEAISLVSHEDRPLMAAIERLMNRKVESRVIQGFEPGSAPAHRDEQPRQHQQQQRRPQQQQRHRGQQPQRNAQRQQRRNGQQHPRGSQPQRPQQRPVQDSAYEDQIREARARMREEGENVPAPSQPHPQSHQQPRRNDGGGQRRSRRGRGRGGNPGNGGGYRSPARNSRDQQWDPRRSEPREPGYGDQRKPNPSRPAPVVQVKQRRTLAGFVGSLLGRKKEEEKT
ncbi:MAG TPA: DEAD/DEAH box helicase [Burkholderiales bacterium]|nr:DEAD/DEAH box helicase [Burkholderiales bacterium]